MNIISKSNNPFKLDKLKKDGIKVKEIEFNTSKKEEINKYKTLDDYCKNNKLNKASISLSEKGIMYAFKNYNLNPVLFYLSLISISAIIGIVFLIFTKNIYISLICSLLSYFLLNRIINYLNKKENNNMMQDICIIYLIMNEKLQNEVYFIDALAYIITKIKNKRLIYALKELKYNILNNNDIDKAILLFNKRFKNEDIDFLVLYLQKIIKIGINEDTDKISITNINKIITKKYKKNNYNVMDMIENSFILYSVLIIIIFIYINIR